MHKGLRAKPVLPTKLWLIPLIIAGSLLTLTVLYQVGKWWLDSRPQTPVTVTAPDPYDDWETVVMLKGETDEQHHRTKLIRRTNSWMEFEYLCRKGKGKVRITSDNNGQDWSGTWEIPGGWGNLTLKLNPQGDSLRGRWTDPESPRPSERDGGRFQIVMR